MEERKDLTRKEKAQIMYANFRTYLYNKEKGEVMGRNAESWGKISLFFLVYYACLTAFFAAMFAIAFSTIPDTKDAPKYNSFIYDKPLLLVYPNGLGSYKLSNLENIKKRYEDFLYGYRDTECYLERKCESGGDYRPEGENRQCGFDLTSLGPCAPNSTFGYEKSNTSPCFYLRLTKIYNWKPEPANSGKFVQLECNPENDKETKIIYHPPNNKAFPISFWPFRGEPAFRTPIAAIQVKGNKKEVNIRCKAIADNIELSDTYKFNRGAHGLLEFTVAAPPSV